MWQSANAISITLYTPVRALGRRNDITPRQIHSLLYRPLRLLFFSCKLIQQLSYLENTLPLTPNQSFLTRRRMKGKKGTVSLASGTRATGSANTLLPSTNAQHTQNKGNVASSCCILLCHHSSIRTQNWQHWHEYICERISRF